jgi:hypothetical protein
MSDERSNGEKEMSKRSKVTIGRIVRLYEKHQNVAVVARIVKRHYTSIYQRLKRAGSL